MSRLSAERYSQMRVTIEYHSQNSNRHIRAIITEGEGCGGSLSVSIEHDEESHLRDRDDRFDEAILRVLRVVPRWMSWLPYVVSHAPPSSVTSGRVIASHHIAGLPSRSCRWPTTWCEAQQSQRRIYRAYAPLVVPLVSFISSVSVMAPRPCVCAVSRVVMLRVTQPWRL